MRVILFILKLIGRILHIPLWLILAFIGVCVSAVVNLYMNYILLGIAEFMLVGVLAAGAFVLTLVSEVRDCVGRFIIGG